MFGWFKRSATETKNRYVVIYVRVPDGMTADLGFRMRDLFNQIDPEGWWFINPGSFLAMFHLANSGHERSAALLSAIDALKTTEPDLADVQIGKVEGKVDLVQTRADGKLLSMPIGNLLNEAVHAATRSSTEA